jgi:uncharacterized metal-binding protein
MKKRVEPSCAKCQIPMRGRICTTPESGKPAARCPTVSRRKLAAQASGEYMKNEVLPFARQASIQEAACYAGREKTPYTMHPVKPRIQETCEFAQRMGYKRLGLAFCGGLAKEGEIVGRLLEAQGFEVISVMCKVGGVPKEAIGLAEEDKVYRGKHESMCNPILQAMILNDAHTEFNVLVGLCVGHDSLFFKYAEAPTTVLAAKDRVTGHSPLAAIYTSESYYVWTGKKGFGEADGEKH